MNDLKNFANEVACKIKELLEEKARVTVAIDGRCASGKTTLAREISRMLKAPVVHADHFFLRPKQRTPERLAEAGGNLDRERLLSEVLIPRVQGEAISYTRFDCSTQALVEKINIPKNPVLIVEGSYSMHPELSGFYDLKIFLTTKKSTQEERLLAREGAGKLVLFQERWIPLEEAYFEELRPSERCDIIFEN